MTLNLLFCVAKEAKSLVPQVLALRNPEYDDVPMFYLVESRVCPTSREGFKETLQDGEVFETDFIGASEEDCQRWERENTPQVNFIAKGLIAIIDARSVKDGTILIQSYQEESLHSEEDETKLDIGFPAFGILPPRDKANTWWSYRVKFEDAFAVLLDLGEFGILEAELPYYGYKDRLTDEHGVFNVAKAQRITFGEEPEAVLGEDPENPQS